MAEGGIFGRAGDMEIIGRIKFSVVDGYDVAISVNEVGSGGGVLVTTEELLLALCKA